MVNNHVDIERKVNFEDTIELKVDTNLFAKMVAAALQRKFLVVWFYFSDPLEEN